MKILMAGDTHMDLEHVQYLVRTATSEQCARVFVLGDFGFYEHMTDGVRFLDKLDRYLNITGLPVYFLDGNHDKTSMIVDRYQDKVDREGFLLVRDHVRYAPRGHRWMWDGVRFIALGGAYSIDKDIRLGWEAQQRKGPGRHWFPEEEMSDEDMDRFLADPEPVDVILAHDMPRGAVPWHGFTSIDGGLPNQDRLKRAIRTLLPAQYLHGHMHCRYDQIMEYGDDDGVLHEVLLRGLGCNSKGMAWGPLEARQGGSWVTFDTEKFNADR